jgi:hypothetical protein
MRRRLILVLWSVHLFAACSDLDSDEPARQARSRLPVALVEYQELARSTIDGVRARDLVAFMDHYVRLPGNRGFDASIEKVIEELEAAGYRDEEEDAVGAPTGKQESR